jgi:hypothetical protein
MSNLLDEQRLTLSALAKREGVNVSTVWRWTLRGVRGVTLDTLSVGARRLTTDEAFARFVAASTAVAQGVSRPATTTVRSNSQRDVANRRAEAELADAGI